MPKIKNIIIFAAIAVVLILLYVFFIKKGPEEEALTSSFPAPVVSGGIANPSDQNSLIAADFLNTLLNVKGISLEDSIFFDPAFLSLQDSSIILIPDGTEGRPNPFAPIGSDVTVEAFPNTNTSPLSFPEGTLILPPEGQIYFPPN